MVHVNVRTALRADGVAVAPYFEAETASELRANVAAAYKTPAELLKLVYQGKVLQDGSLKAAGASDGSTIVVLKRRQKPEPKQRKRVPDVDRATIDEITAEEARARGLPDGPQERVAGGHGNSMRSMEAQLMGLLQSVQGDLAGAAFGAAELRGTSEEEEDEPEAEEEEAADVQVPEPDADGLAQLQDMGFSEGLARKALLLSRNSPDAALEWALQHSEDPDADAPASPSALQSVWRPQRRRRHRRGDPADPALVEQLVEMGFDRQQSDNALRALGNNMEMACQWLLSHAGREEAAAAGGGDGGDEEQQQQHEHAHAMDTSSSEGDEGDEMEGGDEDMHDMDSDSEGSDEMLGHEHDHDMDSESGSDLDEHDDGMNDMPVAEDDFENGLQDIQHAGEPHFAMVPVGGMDFGEGGEMLHFDMQEVLSRLGDPAMLQEITGSPMLIDAVQALLQNSAAYSSLVEHPEMAPYIRSLRRIVGMDADAEYEAPPPAAAATAPRDLATELASALQTAANAGLLQRASAPGDDGAGASAAGPAIVVTMETAQPGSSAAPAAGRAAAESAEASAPQQQGSQAQGTPAGASAGGADASDSVQGTGSGEHRTSSGTAAGLQDNSQQP